MIKQAYSHLRSNSLLRLPLLTLSISLIISGCASEALKRAPSAPDKPWQPNSHKSSDTAMENNTSPASGFSLPALPDAAVLAPKPVIDTQQSYNLPTLIDIAQRENPETRLAWNHAKQAALAVGVLEATYLPQLSANVIAGWQKTHTPITMLPGNYSIDTEIHGVMPALALEWLIFDFGQRAALIEGAEQLSFASNVMFNGTHQKIIHDVTHAYYQYVGTQAQSNIAQQALKNSQQIANAVEQKRAAGLATVLETAQANQQVAQAKLRLTTTHGNQEIAYQALLATVGLPTNIRIDIDSPPENRLPDANSALTEEAIQLAISRRPDVQASYAAMKASTAHIAATEAEFLPKVYLGAVAAHSRNNFDLRGLPSLNQRTGSSSVILGVTIPIFDGGIRLARLQDAHFQAENASERLRQSQQAAMREIIAASHMLRTTLSSHQAASTLVQTASTTYHAALESYRLGVGTLTAVTMADTALLDAKQALMDARTASQQGAAALAFVMGDMDSARESWVP
ncbi:MAG: TolC family protein [Alcaligenaceae bacterium]|nr:TolC family protein [Alcaligenaceae bacterium]